MILHVAHLEGVCLFHRCAGGLWVRLAVKVPYICFVTFGCKILENVWNYPTGQLRDDFFGRKIPNGVRVGLA